MADFDSSSRADIIRRLAAGEQIPGWSYHPEQTKLYGDSQYAQTEPTSAFYNGQGYWADGNPMRNQTLDIKDLAKLAAIMGTAYFGGTALAGMGGGGAGAAGATASTAIPVTDAATAAFLEANVGALAPTVSGGTALGTAGASGFGATVSKMAGGSMKEWIPLIGNLVGAGMSSSAAKSAANTQADAARYAADLQKQIFDKQTELQEPFRQAGLTGQNRLMELLGLAGDPKSQGYGSAMRDFGAQDFQADPGYAFRQAEGQKALERSASARGGLLGGSAMKDAMRFNQGLASDEYTNAFNRFQTNRSNKLNPLQSLAGMAQSSTNQIGNAAQNYATNAGNAAMSGANARASGYVGSANAFNNAIGQSLNAYQQQQIMDRVFPKP